MGRKRAERRSRRGELSFLVRALALIFVEFQLGIERWTDSIRWGPSRVRDVSAAQLIIINTHPLFQEFLYYHEKNATRPDRESTSDSETSVSTLESLLPSCV
jgi:hypothetical protein